MPKLRRSLPSQGYLTVPKQHQSQQDPLLFFHQCPAAPQGICFITKRSEKLNAIGAILYLPSVTL